MSTTPLTSPTVLPALPRNFWLTGFFQSTTWQAFAYHLIALFLGIAGFTYAVTSISLGAGLAVTVIGLTVFAALNVGARHFGEVFRHLSNNLLGSHIPAPLPREPYKSIGQFTKSGIRDPQGWRFMAFSLLHFVNALFAFVISVSMFAIGLGGVTYRFWYEFLPMQQAKDGSWHQGAMFGSDYFIDTPTRIGYTAVISALILFFVWPLVTVKLGALQALNTASLLGPSPQSLKVHELRLQQAATVDRSAAELRSIERDLHDVTQAQLVAIAMKLSDAKDRLASGSAPEEVGSLIDQAHSTSKVALTDLRSLVQGIHPAVLNSGLDTALATLASSSPIPTVLETNLTAPISPAIEAVAYYCAAELLNNVAKHSGSESAKLGAHTTNSTTSPQAPGGTTGQSSDLGAGDQPEGLLTAGPGKLVLQIIDQGVGGARLQDSALTSVGTGLAGLKQRVSAVEGTLEIDSPVGGPTVVTVVIPTTLELA